CSQGMRIGGAYRFLPSFGLGGESALIWAWACRENASIEPRQEDQDGLGLADVDGSVVQLGSGREDPESSLCSEMGIDARSVGVGSAADGFCVHVDGNASIVPSINLHVDLGGRTPSQQRPSFNSSPGIARGFFQSCPSKRSGSKVVVIPATSMLLTSASKSVMQLAREEKIEFLNAGKLLGLEFSGMEEEVIMKIAELKVRDARR
ncbi:hypothetical protein Dimus_016487, partial [Dionaea muscipula]